VSTPPRDGYEQYFAERLWDMIPAIYRHEDGIAENPGVLRALVERMASQAAVLRRSSDRLWEDAFAEDADAWALPYLADLVGTRLVSALNPRGRRVDVAKTIHYRRRSGTPAVVEELVSDIAGWEGVLSESFFRLARSAHGLDPAPAPRGTVTGTPAGGTADLRSTRGALLTGGPLVEYHHTADVRRQHGHAGRFNISKVGLHLYRLGWFEVRSVEPHTRTDGRTFYLDPAKRNTPLFAPRGRPPVGDGWQRPAEWELPAPIGCRLLGDTRFRVTEALILDLATNHGLSAAGQADLRRLVGWDVPGEANFLDALARAGSAAEVTAPALRTRLVAGALVDECGVAGLYPGGFKVRVDGVTVPRHEIVAGDLSSWSVPAVPPGKTLVVDPERGRLLFPGGPPAGDVRVDLHYGFPGAVGAGTYDRRSAEAEAADRVVTGGYSLTAPRLGTTGIMRIDDSLTYNPIADVVGVDDLSLRAGNRERPCLRLTRDWVIRSKAAGDALLEIDGLWISGLRPRTMILRGDYETVTLRNCTVDPGSTLPGSTRIRGGPVTLAVEATIELLRIERSILSSLRVRAGGHIERLEIVDSVLQTVTGSARVLRVPDGTTVLDGVTLVGRAEIHRLQATDTLATGTLRVTDTQAGCFRFSAAPSGSRLPRPYESQVVADQGHHFTTRRFGEPGYLQYAASAPASLRRGSEHGGAIGVWRFLLDPIKEDGLRRKLDEYLPFGLIAMFIYET
jgi:hypothetical protein